MAGEDILPEEERSAEGLGSEPEVDRGVAPEASRSEGGSGDAPTPAVDEGLGDEELNEFGFRPDEMIDDDGEDVFDGGGEDVSPIEEFVEEGVDAGDDAPDMEWYILKVQVNREKKVCEALKRRVKVEGLERYFGDILVPTEDVREFNKAGKQRIVKRKLYAGYIIVNMAINDDSWFLVRETSGIGDFAGAAGKPAPLPPEEVERIMAAARPEQQGDGEETVKTAIPFSLGETVRVKEGYFQNYEGEVSNVDERNGRITVMINIFGRANPGELAHWHVEKV